MGDSTVPPLDREDMPEGVVQEVQLDQDRNEAPEVDKDGEITEQARNLKTLNQYQQDILRLQNKKEQLFRQATARNRSKETQRALREAKIQRDSLVREIQGLQGAGATAAIRVGGNIEIPGDNFVEEDEGPYDPTSPLLKEL